MRVRVRVRVHACGWVRGWVAFVRVRFVRARPEWQAPWDARQADGSCRVAYPHRVGYRVGYRVDTAWIPTCSSGFHSVQRSKICRAPGTLPSISSMYAYLYLRGREPAALRAESALCGVDSASAPALVRC